jgi:hypothetical protein
MRRFSSIVFFLIITSLSIQGYSQVVNSATKKKISIGVGLSTDIMMKVPSGIKTWAINRGANVFATYNVPFGKSNFSFAIGLGIATHNIFGNFLVNSTPDSTALLKIPDSIDYKRSKLTLAYLELPIEFRLKTNNKISVGIGFKGGFMIGSYAKYVGNGIITTYNYTIPTTEKTRIKYWGIKNLETFTYGPTLRVGYKWFNVNGYYMISTLFTKGRGPEMYPISVGFVLMPF